MLDRITFHRIVKPLSIFLSSGEAQEQRRTWKHGAVGGMQPNWKALAGQQSSRGSFWRPLGPGSRPTGVGSEERQQGVAERACPFTVQARLEIEINKSTASPVQSNPCPAKPPLSAKFPPPPLTYHQTKHSPSRSALLCFPFLLLSQVKSL